MPKPTNAQTETTEKTAAQSTDRGASRRVPVTVVTGFLGSGKTTLVNRILQQSDRPLAVLVNELGAIDLDSQRLVATQGDRLSLSNGCICCTINDRLAETIEDLLERSPQLDGIVIETTGVADPRPILLTFSGSSLRDRTRLDAIVTVVDAANFNSINLPNSVALAQIAYSDILLLNKVDLADPENLENLEKYLRSHQKDARILKASYGNIPLPLVLNVGSSRATLTRFPPAEIGTTSDRAEAFNTVSFTSDRPFSIVKFQHFLTDCLPDAVFRAKGILWFKESQLCHQFQLCGRRTDMATEPWQRPPENQLVFIGQNLDALQIQQQLNNCLA